MAFFDDFLTGFATTTTETMQRKSEQRSKESLMDREYGHRTDLARQESIMRLNVEDELAKRKAEREAAKSKADYERALQMRDDLFDPTPIAETTPSTGGVAPFNSAAAAPTQTPDPNLDEYNRQSNLAVGMTELAGDNEYMKTFGKTAGMRADVAKTNAEWTRTAKKQAREEGRQPLIDSNKVNFIEALQKAETERLSKPTKSRYLPVQTAVDPNTNDKASVLEKESSAAAIDVASIIAKANTDELGNSEMTATELDAHAQEILVQRNILLAKDIKPEIKASTRNILKQNMLESVGNDVDMYAKIYERIFPTELEKLAGITPTLPEIEKGPIGIDLPEEDISPPIEPVPTKRVKFDSKGNRIQ